MSGLEARIRVPREHFDVDVALSVAEGETVAVMGPSGAGKSTLLGALAGMVEVAEGEISAGGRLLERAGAGGRPVRTPPMRRGIVLLDQDARLFPHLSARENVAFGPRAAGGARGDARAGADAWLERVGLPGAGDRRPHELSGGEQQRVAVARALAASPRVVLLDEPLVALDPETASGIRGMLRAQLAGITAVAVTHDAVDAVALADRLVVIERGRVVQQGDVRGVLAAPASGFVASIAGLTRLVGRARGGAWERDGMRLDAADPASLAAARADGASLAAVFRPVDVRLADAAGPNTWQARVTALEPTPAGVRVQTDAGAIDLPLEAAATLAPGDRLTLHVDPAHVRLLPA